MASGWSVNGEEKKVLAGLREMVVSVTETQFNSTERF